MHPIDAYGHSVAAILLVGTVVTLLGDWLIQRRAR